jgi:hypothetical protein
MITATCCCCCFSVTSQNTNAHATTKTKQLYNHSGTTSHKKALNTAIDEIRAEGRTNMYNGLNAAYGLLAQNRFRSHCQEFVVLITDGEGVDEDAYCCCSRNSDGDRVHYQCRDNSQRQALELVQSHAHSTRLFSYMPYSGYHNIGALMACASNGHHTTLFGTGFLRKGMQQYFQFLAQNAQAEGIVWSAPYIVRVLYLLACMPIPPSSSALSLFLSHTHTQHNSFRNIGCKRAWSHGHRVAAAL